MMAIRTPGRALLGLVLLLAGAGAARAGSFAVTPVRATLAAGQTVQTLTVRNTGATEAVVQLELLKWSQQDGKDIFEASRDVLATPPLFTLPPQGQQVIRVGLRTPPDATGERSYRLFLTEVPPPPAPGTQGLQIALQISLPVFITPATKASPRLQWRATREGSGLRLSVTNSGMGHVQVTGLRLAQADGAELVRRSALSDYVLPGQARSWLLQPATAVSAATGSRLQLQAQSDAGALTAEVIVE